jgi:hypothetical protein
LNQVDLRHQLAKSIMHRLNHGLRLGATSHIRLVGGDDQGKTCVLKLRATGGYTGEQDEFLECAGRVGLPISDDRGVKRAISVEKNSRL